jgi:Transcription initiation factor IIB (TFIIB)
MHKHMKNLQEKIPWDLQQQHYTCHVSKMEKIEHKRDIAEAANVTEVTIRNRYKGLRLDQSMNR